MKHYVVVYLNAYDLHCRYRCTAENKREARKMCREYMCVSDKKIVEVYDEFAESERRRKVWENL